MSLKALVVFGSDRPTEALATVPRRRNSESPVCNFICGTAPVCRKIPLSKHLRRTKRSLAAFFASFASPLRTFIRALQAGPDATARGPKESYKPQGTKRLELPEGICGEPRNRLKQAWFLPSSLLILYRR